MNKYDSFSISHLIAFLSAYHSNKMVKMEYRSHIIFWSDLKEIIEKCNLKELVKE